MRRKTLSPVSTILQHSSVLKRPWRLVFNENFSSLDQDIWSRSDISSGSGWARPESVEIVNNQARIGVTDDAYGGQDYTSGELHTRYKFEFKYGLITARIKYASGQGLWGAFWPFEGNETPYEIDICEYLGRLPNRMYFVYHWDDGGHQQSLAQWDGPDFSADFHIYSALWDPTQIVFYIDNVPHHRVANDFIYDDYMYLRFINFTGNDDAWAGLPDETTPFPSYAYCDWMRVYQFEEDYITRDFRDLSLDSGNLSGTDDSFDLLVGEEDLAVNSGAALAGSANGLQVTINDTDGHYGRLDIQPEKGYIGKYLRLRAYIDPNSLTMAAEDEFKACRILTSLGWTDYWYVSLEFTGGVYNLLFVGNDDAVGWNRVKRVAISDAPHYFEVAMVRAESDVSADGSLAFLVDGVQEAAWANQDNYDIFGGSSYVGVGAIGPDAGTSGTFYIDEIKISVLNEEIGA